MYCTPQQVIKFIGVTPQQFGLQKTDTNGLIAILTEWILQADSLIDDFCNNPSIETNTPKSVENVSMRITANMVSLAQARKNTPVINVDDWKVSILDFEVFPQFLKDDLRKYKISESNDSATIDIFTVVGEF